MSRQPAKAKYTPKQVWSVFERYLPESVIDRILKQMGVRFYKRLFPPMVVIWGFIFQRLNHDHSCDAYVAYLSGDADNPLRCIAQTAGKAMSESTAAYCKARRRLPAKLANAALQSSAQLVGEILNGAGKWQGYAVYLLDGSTIRLVAEAELIEYYGQPAGRRGKSHWPALRTVAAFDLFSGAAQAVADGPYAAGEYGPGVEVIGQLPEGCVVMGDQLFGIYRFVQVAYHSHQEAIFRIQAGHVRRWVKSQLPSGTDLHVVWSPSKDDKTEPGLPALDIPGRLIYVRIEQPGFRPIDLYLFTTLTDAEQFPAHQIIHLYGLRWNVELDLRHVKTTLQMETLSGKSVDIVQKELRFGLLAYNLIRGLMAEAALQVGLCPLQLSFARCWRRVANLRHHSSAPLTDEAHCDLLTRLAACRLPVRRKLRVEPRAVWGKPQPYPFLKGSRQLARQACLQEKLKC